MYLTLIHAFKVRNFWSAWVAQSSVWLRTWFQGHEFKPRVGLCSWAPCWTLCWLWSLLKNVCVCLFLKWETSVGGKHLTFNYSKLVVIWCLKRLFCYQGQKCWNQSEKYGLYCKGSKEYCKQLCQTLACQAWPLLVYLHTVKMNGTHCGFIGCTLEMMALPLGKD